MNQIQTTSPASSRTPVSGTNSLEELPWCGKIIIRGNPENAAFLEGVKSALNIKLPLEPNTCVTSASLTGYWLGPDEWLIQCETESLDSNITKLKKALTGIHNAVVDVTDYYTVLMLEGPDASELLAKACPLDLHPNVFGDNACTQTRFGHASILLHRISSTPAYRIQIRWSFTEYVWDYLLSGMKTLQNPDQ